MKVCINTSVKSFLLSEFSECMVLRLDTFFIDFLHVASLVILG